MDAKLIKARVASYWRYDRQCPMVAFEANSHLVSWSDGGLADVLVVTKKGQLLEVEVKVSITDLKRDSQKPKHYSMQDPISKCPLHFFYFAVGNTLEEKALQVVEDIYPYAGLLSVKEGHFVYAISGVEVVKDPRYMDRPKLTPLQLGRMAREMSATICRLSRSLYFNGKKDGCYYYTTCFECPEYDCIGAWY